MIARKTNPTVQNQPAYLDDLEMISGTLPPEFEQQKHKQQHTMSKARQWMHRLMTQQEKKS